MKNFIFFIFLMTMFCTSSNAQHDAIKPSIGKFTDEDFASFKKILSQDGSSSLNDTIIIKYDYNSTECWQFLDKQSDEYIMKVVTGMQTSIAKAKAARPGISVFHYRQKGNAVNKNISWDTTIIIDKDKKIFRTLFKKRSICGSSAIILPNGRFIVFQSDPHFDSLDLSGEKISQLL